MTTTLGGSGAELGRPPRRSGDERPRAGRTTDGDDVTQDDAPVVTTSSPRLAHLRPLDGLRGVAVLAAVLYHFMPGITQGGFLGVDMFFVLSGFLITSLLVNEREATRRISLPTFWVRRARRLLPALFLVLAAIGLYATFVTGGVDAQHIGNDGLAAFSYVANWHFIASGQGYIQQFVRQAPSPVRHMWSLAIEEQFYLAWPIVVVAIGALTLGHRNRSRDHHRRLRYAMVAVSVILGVTSFVRMLTLYQPTNPNRVYYGTDTRAWVLLVGAMLGALTAGAPAIARRRPRRAVIAAGSFAAVTLTVAMFFVTAGSSRLYEGGYGLVVVAIAVVLVAAVQPGPNALRLLLESRPLVGLGLISYGVYLWHWPVTVWLTPASAGVDGVELFALRSAITLAAALLSYYFIEQPIRQGRLPQWKGASPGVVPMTMVTAVAITLLIPALVFPSVPQAPTATSAGARATALAYANGSRCDASAAPIPPLIAGRQVHVQLVGNSVAQEVVPCLTTILQARGVRLEPATANGVAVCDLLPRIHQQLDDLATRPQVGVLFAIPYDHPPCAPKSSWLTQVQQLVGIWKRAGMEIFLVPPVPIALSSVSKPDTLTNDGPPGGTTARHRQTDDYLRLAQQNPGTVGILDAGSFLRDPSGVYLWRMPCVPGGEAGCGANHTVAVRNPRDTGLHFCADPTFAFTGAPCLARFAAGERRAAAGLGYGLIVSLQATIRTIARHTP